MAFVSLINLLYVLQLSLLICSSVTGVYGDEALATQDQHAPPVKPPTYPPPPVRPPPPPTKRVAVEGVVYCKSCKYRGVDVLNAAAPLAGAVVKLQCKEKKYSLVEQVKTDKNGYFFIMPQEKLATADAQKYCKVFLVSSPHHKCDVATNLHGGIAGAVLVPTPTKTSYFELFTVGPFAFEPPKKLPCYY